MIYTDKQREITGREIEKFEQKLVALENLDSDAPNWRQIEESAIRSQVNVMETAILEYDRLKAGEVSLNEPCTIDELPTLLVKARIASGQSHIDFARKMGVTPEQQLRYEDSRYYGVNLDRLIDIAKILDLSTTALFDLDMSSSDSEHSWTNEQDFDWRRIPAAEMERRNWFQILRQLNPIDAVQEYFRKEAPPQGNRIRISF